MSQRSDNHVAGQPSTAFCRQKKAAGNSLNSSQSAQFYRRSTPRKKAAIPAYAYALCSPVQHEHHKPARILVHIVTIRRLRTASKFHG